MKKIFAFVEKNDNGFYQISCDESWNGYNFGGYGHSVEEAKADFMDSVEEAKEMAAEQGIVNEEEIVVSFKYDLESFFNYFDWINVTQLARIAGINESKMRQYKAGLAYASEKTARKLLTTIRRIGAELQAAEI
jgi:hypothetical protein